MPIVAPYMGRNLPHFSNERTRSTDCKPTLPKEEEEEEEEWEDKEVEEEEDEEGEEEEMGEGEHS